MHIKPVGKHQIYISVLLLLISISSFAQKNYYYNLNSYNSLPSDHVYCMFKDRFGYLWIGTDNGIIQYDGYDTKVYNISNGLVDADVWDFYEDAKGRIWLSRISREMGYMLNGKYHKVHVNQKHIPTIYPKYIRQYKTGVKFITVDGGVTYLCTEQNDSLHIDKLANWDHNSGAGIMANGKIIFWTKEAIYEVIQKRDNSFKLIEKCKNNRYAERVLLSNYLIPKTEIQLNKLYALSPDSCKELEIEFDSNDRIYNQYENEGKNYIVTDHKLYILDKNLKNSTSHLLVNYCPEIELYNNRLVYAIEDTFWSKCIATKKSGIYFAFEMPHFKTDNNKELLKYRHVGTGINGMNYWWNSENSTLKYSIDNIKYKTTRYQTLENINRIIPYTSTQLLVFSYSNIYILDTKTMVLSAFSKGAKYYSYIDNINAPLSKFNDIRNIQEYRIGAITNGTFDNKGHIHCITSGYGYINLKYSEDTLICNRIDAERFNDILYDSLNHTCIIYNTNSIMVHTDDTIYKIDNSILEENNISKIEKIFLNNDGSVLIKDYNKIVWCDIYNQKFKELYSQQRLKNTLAYLHNGVLIIAGKFGVQFTKIRTDNLTTQCISYNNIKGLAYNYVFDIIINNNSVQLNTDSGLISVSIPHDSFYSNVMTKSPSRYRFTLKYKNEYRSIKSSDTIIVSQKNRSLHFKVINPTGVGKVSYKSFIEGIDTALTLWEGSEIHLSKMEIGKYYTMYIKAIDDIWESDKMAVTVYITPTFWQTQTGRIIFWICIGLLSLIVVIITMFYTVKIVSKKHARKNYLLSLELRSIYAQINPHFIFNTINTGLYYISENKNNEAYNHISTFSDLLRSYIKSVRNKYITLAEEIENLENYILLYQSRYEDRFVYSIHVDDVVDTNAKVIPALLLQPFVENAIRHGLLHLENGGVLTLSFSCSNKDIVCKIDDNGVGREKSAIWKEEHEKNVDSYGNKLIKELVDIINAENKINITIEYVDKSPPLRGTIVIITIKRNHHGQKSHIHNH